MLVVWHEKDLSHLDLPPSGGGAFARPCHRLVHVSAFQYVKTTEVFLGLKKSGVKFTMDPKQQGPVKLAIFSDTCGNLIQMYQPPQNRA